MLTITLITPVSDDVIATNIDPTIDHAEAAARFVAAYVAMYDLTDCDVTMSDDVNGDMYNFDFVNHTWIAI